MKNIFKLDFMACTFDGKNINYKYNDGEVIRILSNVPKSEKARIKLFKKIEEKARNNNYNNQTPYDQQCENFYSLRNRYERQWEALGVLIYGSENGKGMTPDVDYDYGDVLA